MKEFDGSQGPIGTRGASRQKSAADDWVGSKADRSERQKIAETEAVKEIEAALAKGPRRGRKPAEEAGAEEAVGEEAA